MKHQALALYVTAGFGHLKPALSLLKHLKPHGIHTESWDVLADEIGESPRKKYSLYNYISTNPHLIPLWNKLTRHDLIGPTFLKPFHWYDTVANSPVIQRLKYRFKENKNTIIFCTHFTPANLASLALPHHKIFLLATDIHLHALWTVNRPNVHYLIPHSDTKKDLLKYGISEKNIHLTGFPINPNLIKGHAQRHKKRVVNLKKEHTTDILIISGGAGTGKIQMQNLLKTFATPAHAHNVEIKLLASTNKLQQALEHTCRQEGLSKQAVTIDTYTPQKLYQSMRWAEVLITKAGGDITFEAIAEGLPIYTLKDVGDHERLNRKYLESVGASKKLEATVYPWELIHHDILTGSLSKMCYNSYKAGKTHRDFDWTKFLFNQMGWKLAKKTTYNS